MSDYPEHDKLQKLGDKNQVLGEFIEWLKSEKKYTIAEYAEKEVDKKGNPVYRDSDGKIVNDWRPIPFSILTEEKCIENERIMIERGIEQRLVKAGDGPGYFAKLYPVCILSSIMNNGKTY